MNDFYSPVQNISLWFGAWLYGHVSFDELHASLLELDGPHMLDDAPEHLVDLAKIVRTHAPIGHEVPALTFLFGGAGQSLGPSIGSQHAILLGSSTVLVPHAIPDGMIWQHREYPLPYPGILLPGEADLQLAEAARRAARLIDTAIPSHEVRVDPRLKVGTLHDHYDIPGLPAATPARSVKLLARANRLSAIVETVLNHYGQHRYDPVLLELAMAVRQARMSAVHYAVAEWGRLAG
ncbi:hypothetical protein [Corynebacterium sp. HS2168-gen11]|uniref:hypothetical protein n=1 Tax=Corynebacterium sp. HS2168-gen11 TaxID=2974027 RepID=UPI00216AF766|nr:hypothetical protein [Corynebacterium sp. HS2168-gen11]MCS4535107.1 hypothetical protein [Corynebacterium sp. HS2168-gen11]